MTDQEEIHYLKALLAEARAELAAVYELPVLDWKLVVCELCGYRLREEAHSPGCLLARITAALGEKN